MGRDFELKTKYMDEKTVSTPKVTVMMPVYNGSKFIKKAIESILSQEFIDYEFIIIDDGSEDNTADIISSYNDKRIRFIQKRENTGQRESLNIGVELSRGQYITFIDHDDVFLPGRLQEEVEILDRADDIAFVYANSYAIDEEGKRADITLFDRTKPYRSFVFDKLIKRNFIPASTIMIRKSMFKKIGFFNPAYPIAAEYDLSLRLARKYKVDFVDKPLVEYRIHDGNISGDPEKTTKEVIEVLKNLDSPLLGKKEKIILDKMISWRIASLGTCYLFRYNRRLAIAKAMEALRIDLFNLKAVATIFMAVFFPTPLLDYMDSFRRKRSDVIKRANVKR